MGIGVWVWMRGAQTLPSIPAEITIKTGWRMRLAAGAAVFALALGMSAYAATAGGVPNDRDVRAGGDGSQTEDDIEAAESESKPGTEDPSAKEAEEDEAENDAAAEEAGEEAADASDTKTEPAAKAKIKPAAKTGPGDEPGTAAHAEPAVEAYDADLDSGTVPEESADALMRPIEPIFKSSNGAEEDDSSQPNLVGPPLVKTSTPWIVEPQFPPSDTIIVEGEMSDFHQAITMAEWLDYFYADERSEEEINYTRIRLRGDIFWEDGEGVQFKPGTNFRISVPGLERRLLLFFSGDLDDGFNDGDPDKTGEDRLDPEEEGNALLGIQAFLNATRKLNISLRGGIRFRDDTPVLFAGPRYRKLFNLDPWAMRVTAEARWFTDEGVATRGYVDFERHFGRHLFFRITPQFSWSEEDENFEYRANARLYHHLSPGSVLRYDAGIEFDTDGDEQLEEIKFRVGWRRRIYKDWLVMEIAPQVKFREEDDFKASFGVLLRLETTFDFHMPWWNRPPDADKDQNAGANKKSENEK